MIKFISTGFKYGINFNGLNPEKSINSILIDVISLPDNKDIRHQDFFQEAIVFLSDYISEILKKIDIKNENFLIVLACHSGENRSYHLCEKLCSEFKCEYEHWNGMEQNINIMNHYVIYKNNSKFSIQEISLNTEIFELDYNNSELFKRRKLINQLKSIKV